MKTLIPITGLVLFLAAPLAQAVTCQNGIAASNPDAAYSDHGDGTITDSRTGLMWDKCTWGQTGDDCAGGGASTHTWDAALAVAATANAATWKGHADWRVPNIKELESLTEECRISPAINDTLFPNTPGWNFWSGSPYAGGSNFAWLVFFGVGYAAYDYRDYYHRVRLVRGGQSFDTFDAAGDVTAPVLSSVGVSGTSQTATTLAATSDEAATGYWVVVARNAAAPTAGQAKAGADYGAVTVVATGSGAMAAATAANFAVSGLTAATDYDLYLVAQDGSVNANFSALSGPVQFTTSSNTYAMTATANPVAAGTASCTPSTVNHGGSSTCTYTVNPGYSFVEWSGDCAGASCDPSNVTSAQNVTANFAPVTSYTGPTPASGDASLAVAGAGCALTGAQFVAAPAGSPANTSFPHGLADFTVVNCTEPVQVTVTYPSPIPAGAKYWKEDGGVYTEYPATIGEYSVTFTLTDGGPGDSDGAANGSISDPSGVGVTAAAQNGDTQPIPSLGAWGLLLLSGLLGLFGMVARRR